MFSLQSCQCSHKSQCPFTPSVYAEPPLLEATASTQPQRTTTVTTTTTAHWGAANTTTTTVLKEGSRRAPRPPPVIPQTTSPPPLESFPLPERFCKATEKRDITWPQTQRGMLVERPCPKGTRGKQSFLPTHGCVPAVCMWSISRENSWLCQIRLRDLLARILFIYKEHDCHKICEKHFVMVLGYSCVIHCINLIKKCVMAVLERSRLACLPHQLAWRFVFLFWLCEIVLRLDQTWHRFGEGGGILPLCWKSRNKMWIFPVKSCWNN